VGHGLYKMLKESVYGGSTLLQNTDKYLPNYSS